MNPLRAIAIIFLYPFICLGWLIDATLCLIFNRPADEFPNLVDIFGEV